MLARHADRAGPHSRLRWRKPLVAPVLAAVLAAVLAVCGPLSAGEAQDGQKYLRAVRTFADNVLECGKDTYGPKQTPLLVDGVDLETGRPAGSSPSPAPAR